MKPKKSVSSQVRVHDVVGALFLTNRWIQNGKPIKTAVSICHPRYYEKPCSSKGFWDRLRNGTAVGEKGLIPAEEGFKSASSENGFIHNKLPLLFVVVLCLPKQFFNFTLLSMTFRRFCTVMVVFGRDSQSAIRFHLNYHLSTHL